MSVDSLFFHLLSIGFATRICGTAKSGDTGILFIQIHDAAADRTERLVRISQTSRFRDKLSAAQQTQVLLLSQPVVAESVKSGSLTGRARWSVNRILQRRLRIKCIFCTSQAVFSCHQALRYISQQPAQSGTEDESPTDSIRYHARISDNIHRFHAVCRHTTVNAHCSGSCFQADFRRFCRPLHPRHS